MWQPLARADARQSKQTKGAHKVKYFFASDIHGSAYWCERMIEKFKESGAERMILLGDVLYHGPRNDLPKEYAPKACIAMLNALKDSIYCVRGNCEAEVDQMVLEFPVLADYALLELNGHTFYATHGHVYNQEHMPPMRAGDILIHGHTHLLAAERFERDGKTYVFLNPGSVSIPKGGNSNSYAILDGDVFHIFDFDGTVIKELTL